MKKYFKVIICFIGLVCAMILILGISFSYITNYKKVTIDTSNSPDGKYELTLQAVGEPGWPFGSASGQLVLKEGKEKVSHRKKSHLYMKQIQSLGRRSCSEK